MKYAISEGSQLSGSGDKGQSDTIAAELRNESYECLVCISNVRREDAVWSCSTCHCVLHLSCVTTWRAKSLGLLPEERPGGGGGGGRGGGGRGSRGGGGGGGGSGPSAANASVVRHDTGGGGDGKSWRCPGCQTHTTVLPKNLCFCGKTRAPEPDPFLIPHTCSSKCSKRRPGGLCPHPCDSPCHPGPCAPCTAQAPPRPCGCGRRMFTSKCGVVVKSGGGVGGDSCGEVCGKTLSCGNKSHKCKKVCHKGPCGACEQTVPQSCYCGDLVGVKRLCGTGDAKERSCAQGGVGGKSGRGGWGGAFGVEGGEEEEGGGGEHHHHPHIPPCIRIHGGEGEGGRVSIPVEPGLFLPSPPSIPSLISPITGEWVKGEGMEALILFATEGKGVGVIEAEARKMRAVGDGKDATTSPFPLLLPVPTTASSFGHFSCGKACPHWLDCGLHRCDRVCHGGECAPCSRAPGVVKTCACGATNLALMMGNTKKRTLCLDPLPTCSNLCGKPRECGHTCVTPCHDGPCPPCSVEIKGVVACTCGSARAHTPLTCHEVYAAAAMGGDFSEWLKVNKSRKAGGKGVGGGGASVTPASAVAIAAAAAGLTPPPLPLSNLLTFPLHLVQAMLRCSKPCGRNLHCSRHACKRVCCGVAGGGWSGDALPVGVELAEEVRAQILDSSSGSSSGGGGGGGGDGGSSTLALSPPSAATATYLAAQATLSQGHMCLRTCGRALACGSHMCDNPCHTGACPPCSHVSRAPISCTCGSVVVNPPVACGAPPPTCPKPCSIRRPCGHPHSQWHKCHTGPCPPCTILTNRPCSGGHTMRQGVPCNITDLTCGAPCGKLRHCGTHRCPRVCHSGPCGGGGVDAEGELALLKGVDPSTLSPSVREGLDFMNGAVGAYEGLMEWVFGGREEHCHGIAMEWLNGSFTPLPSPTTLTFVQSMVREVEEDRERGGGVSSNNASWPVFSRGGGDEDFAALLRASTPPSVGSVATPITLEALERGGGGGGGSGGGGSFGAVEGGVSGEGLDEATRKLCFGILARVATMQLCRQIEDWGGGGGGSGGSSGGGGGPPSATSGRTRFFFTAMEEGKRKVRVSAAALISKRTLGGCEEGGLLVQAMNRKPQGCGLPCDAPRVYCPHTCAHPCHPGEKCPAIPCKSLAIFPCACGRLCVTAVCGMGGANGGGGGVGGGVCGDDTLQPNSLQSSPLCPPCDPLCASSARTRAMASAMGVTAPVCAFPDALLFWAAANDVMCDRVEKVLRSLLSSAPNVTGTDLPPMDNTMRASVHQLAALYGVNSVSYGSDPRRYVRLNKRSVGAHPTNGPKLTLMTSGGGGEVSTALPDSSIGSVHPVTGALILPSMTLKEAAKAHAGHLARLTASRAAKLSDGGGGGRGGGGGGGGGPSATSKAPSLLDLGFLRLHPSEPHWSEIQPADLGSKLHLMRAKKGLQAGVLREALKSTGGDIAASFTRFEFLDNANIVITFDSPARSARALAAFAALKARGQTGEIGEMSALRYWGVGVEEKLKETLASTNFMDMRGVKEAFVDVPSGGDGVEGEEELKEGGGVDEEGVEEEEVGGEEEEGETQAAQAEGGAGEEDEGVKGRVVVEDLGEEGEEEEQGRAGDLGGGGFTRPTSTPATLPFKEQQQQQPPPPSGDEWACPDCTFINSSLLNNCEMCGY